MLFPHTSHALVDIATAIDFDAADGQYIETTTNLAAISTGDFCCEAWIKPETLPGVESGIIGIGGGSGAANGVSLFLKSNGKVRVRINGSSASTTEAGLENTITAGSWFHVAVTRSSGVVNSWIDGDASNNNANAFSIDANKLILATLEAGSAFSSFEGKIALARWSNAARYTSTFTPATSYGVDADTVGFISGINGNEIRETTGFALTLAGNTGQPTPDAEVPS